MDISARSLKIKRRVITQLMENGLYPYTKRYLGTFANHFSTIGLVGMNEACLNANWIREDLTHTAAQKFTAAVLNHMRERLSDYQEMYGDLYNLEATPAESTSYRFCQTRQGALPGHHHGCPRRRYSLLYQLLPPAGRLHGGHLHGAGYSGRVADAVHIGNGFPCIPWRKASRLEGCGGTCAQDCGELPPALLHAVPHLFGLPRPWLSDR